MWDSAGLERYRALIPSYVRGASLIFIIYDVSSIETFNNLGTWINFIKQVNTDNSMIILCGNKTDLNREVETKEGEEVAEREGIKFFECSAKTNENIKYMFYASIAGLPTFGIIDESEKENLVKELLEENGGEENQEGGNENLVKQPAAQLNVNGEVISGSEKRIKCGC